MIVERRPLFLMVSAAAVLVVAAGIWALRTFDPNLPGNPFPPCIFRAVTGYFCAGCGITRALHALVHGDLMAALRFNVLAVGLLFLAPFVALWQLGWQPRIMAPAARILGKPAFWLVLLPAYWVARNLPWAPFTWLAPG